MTLAQMQYFQAVCKYENYSKAANALFVSQPAVSQAIREVENECGARLIERKGNGLVITEAGQTLLEEVNNVLRHVDHVNYSAINDRASCFIAAACPKELTRSDSGRRLHRRCRFGQFRPYRIRILRRFPDSAGTGVYLPA